MTRVDLIIPTRNGSHWLRTCLQSLANSTYRDFNIIVFDDASTECVSDVVGDAFPGAEVLRSEINVGLAQGFNRAIRHGWSEYVVLLNNDTDVHPDWLAQLVACADRHPSAGSVASKIRLMADRRKLHSAGDYYSVRAMPGNRGVWLDDFGQYDRETEIFGACGGAALYRRSALADIEARDGYIFDERLFMYCEDVDLSWRLQQAGWPCVFAPQAIVYHALSATGGGAFASYYVARNIWLVLARSVPADLLSPYRRRILAYHSGRVIDAIRHLREPAARATLRGTIAGLALLAWQRRGRAEPVDEVERRRLLALLHQP